jgi:hypothetical protein
MPEFNITWEARHTSLFEPPYFGHARGQNETKISAADAVTAVRLLRRARPGVDVLEVTDDAGRSHVLDFAALVDRDKMVQEFVDNLNRASLAHDRYWKLIRAGVPHKTAAVIAGHHSAG